MTDFAPQPLPNWRRAVLKVGSSLLAEAGGGLSDRHAMALARFIAGARAQGREVVLVSSGAVAAGRGRIAAGGDGIAMKQALAALGQAALMGFWQSLSEVPVVATAVGGVPSVVVDGVTGRLLRQPAPAELALAIREAMVHHDDWGRAARRRALQRFSMDEIARQWDTLLRDVLAESGQRRTSR